MLDQPDRDVGKDEFCWAMVSERKKCPEKAVWVYQEFYPDRDIEGPVYTQMCDFHYAEWKEPIMPPNNGKAWYWEHKDKDVKASDT